MNGERSRGDGRGRMRRFVDVCLALIVTVTVYCLLFTVHFPLRTPDQQGYRLYGQGEYAEAAQHFADPMWKGVALFEAGEFVDAAGLLSGFDTAETAYNQGNALVMQGKYQDAIGRYERALALHPGWEDAEVNLGIAGIRAERIKKEGGDMTGGKMGADEISFETGKPPPGADEEQVEGGEALSDSEMRASWLRRVQTKPADFLRAKFAYQHAVGRSEQEAIKSER